MSGPERPRQRLGTWGAIAMVVGETIGVGIFLTPATMMRTLGTAPRALAVWAVMGALTMAGALCYAELSTRFPRAGGTYVYLRQAFGSRCAFVYGWMALLVIDPGLTAALGIGAAQYALAAAGVSPGARVPTAIAIVIALGGLTLLGIRTSTRILRGSVVAKLTAVTALVIAALMRAGGHNAVTVAAAPLGPSVLAPAIVAAFFAFGGWWDLGRMSEEVESPRRTMPRALLGGVALVTAIYALVSVGLLLSAPPGPVPSDEALVDLAGAAAFGAAASRTLSVIVVIAVTGSLAAVLLAAPRVYVAMARDGLIPAWLVGFDQQRGTSLGATAIQVALACVLMLLGTFDQILAYFVPGAVFFLGLSALSMLRLPRPAADADVFVSPWHPVPLVLFLVLVLAMLALFIMGQPRETLIGAFVIALGIPASFALERVLGAPLAE